jgi:hypothetical protein
MARKIGISISQGWMHSSSSDSEFSSLQIQETNEGTKETVSSNSLQRNLKDMKTKVFEVKTKSSYEEMPSKLSSNSKK